MSDYPKNPTNGWLYSELERNGIHARGMQWTRKHMIKLLEEKGYVFQTSTEEDGKRRDDR